MKDWMIGLALMAIYLGGFAVILWMCWIYLNGGF